MPCCRWNQKLLDAQSQGTRHGAALAAVADNLLAHETLDREQVEEIVGEWLP